VWGRNGENELLEKTLMSPSSNSLEQAGLNIREQALDSEEALAIERKKNSVREE
jgi:hypothetical protein